jgi:hypothetical protein
MAIGNNGNSPRSPKEKPVTVQATPYQTLSVPDQRRMMIS